MKDLLLCKAIMNMSEEEKSDFWNNLNDEEMAELLCMPNAWLVRMFGLSNYKIKKQKEAFKESSKAYLNYKIRDGLLLNKEFSQKLCVGLTHHIFRNGPIEDMHSDSNKNITDEDMKELNKYMMSRLATFFYLMRNEDFIKIHNLLSFHMNYFGKDWDNVSQEEIDEILDKELSID